MVILYIGDGTIAVVKRSADSPFTFVLYAAPVDRCFIYTVSTVKIPVVDLVLGSNETVLPPWPKFEMFVWTANDRHKNTLPEH